MSTKRIDVDFERVKAEILKQSGSLIVVTNSNFKSDYVVAYRFTSKELKNDADLRYILFGRVSTENALKIDKYACNGLAKDYTKNLIDFVSTVNVFETIAQENNINYGYVAEKLLTENGYKKASNKQDKNGIDVINLKDNTRSQVKCSIIKPDSHGSAGTTNKKARWKRKSPIKKNRAFLLAYPI